MMWTVWHRCMAGEMFTFNFYMHWAQLLLCQPGERPVTILSREGVIQGDPLLMDLYEITLAPPGQGAKISGPGASIHVLHGRCGVLQLGTRKCTALKAVDEEGD